MKNRKNNLIQICAVVLSLVVMTVFTINDSYSGFHLLNKSVGKWAVKTTGKRAMDNFYGFGSKDAAAWAYINATGDWGGYDADEIAWIKTHTIEENEDEMVRCFKASKLSDQNLLKGEMDKMFGTGTYAHYCKRHKIKDKTTFDTSSFGAGEYGYLFGKTNTPTPAANTPTSQDELLAQYQAALAKQQKTANTPASQEELLAQYYAALAKQQK